MTTAPSTITITCPTCNEPYHVSPTHLGKNLKCRNCETVFQLKDSTAGAPARGSGGAAPAGRPEGA